jgi:hypothetical protein
MRNCIAPWPSDAHEGIKAAVAKILTKMIDVSG